MVIEEPPPEAVRAELRNIIRSRHFRTSKRSQQFLQYVVEQKLLGNDPLIKERLIGIEVFGRDTNYATGEDPVVRVQASDVRRRLDAYHMDQHREGDVTIELPTGTYVPVLRKRSATTGPASVGLITGAASNAAQAQNTDLPDKDAKSGQALTASVLPDSTVLRRLRVRQGLGGAVLLILGIVVGRLTHFPPRPPDSVVQFWGPLLSSNKAVVVNLGRPAVYVPTRRLFDLYDTDRTGIFDRVDDRHNNFIPLDKKTPITWGDMLPVQHAGPAAEGVRASLTIASFLGGVGKPFSVRFGEDGSFAELRDSPAIIIGNWNNRWTTDLENGLPLRFYQSAAGEDIREAGTKRKWGIASSGEVDRDYGLITREPAGITGTFLLKVAGIRGGGTEAACEFVTEPNSLRTAISSLPPGWEGKNLQILVTTQDIGRKSSSPQVVTTRVW